MRVDHYVHFDPIKITLTEETAASADALAPLLAAITALQKDVQAMSGTQSALDQAIASLQAQVTQETTVNQSAVTLLNGIPALIQAAVSQAQAAGATPAQLQALTDLGTTIASNTSGLSAAVTANTPAAPADTVAAAAASSPPAS
jgi:hypothetical protein